MSSRPTGAIQSVEVMLNGSLRRLENLKGMNREALYDEYKEWLEVDQIVVLTSPYRYLARSAAG